MKKVISILNNYLLSPPRFKDALFLIIFTILITLHPYYLNNRINVFELGLYLPGINGIMHGLIPYKDFFHLRGPLELYAPVWLMQIFGTHIQVLCAYFFFGNVLCLILISLIALELIRSRYIFYMLIPVMVARTHPRVVFMIWGGMRYAFGLMAIYCFIKFLKSKKIGWILGAGFLTACATLTSIEMGVYVAAAVFGCYLIGWMTRSISAREAWRGCVLFIAAGALGISPWVIYSIQHQAFIPYLDAIWTVVFRLHEVISPHRASIYPHNFPEAFAAMVNPNNLNFRQMTPSYLYVCLLGYLIWHWRKAKWGVEELCLLSLGIFGFIMYNTAFRAIWAAQFEMALMPEKIIYFFLIEVAVLSMWRSKGLEAYGRKLAVAVLLIALFVFSLSYALVRYNKRFWSYQYVANVLSGKDINYLKYADKDEKYTQLTIERAKGIFVPTSQAKELNQIDEFVKRYSKRDDIFVMFPELGMYNFLFDRPFLGGFSISTFTWINDRWFDEYFRQFKELKAKFILVQKKMPENWDTVYLGYAPSKVKYHQMRAVIDQSYVKVSETDDAWIYVRK